MPYYRDERQELINEIGTREQFYAHPGRRRQAELNMQRLHQELYGAEQEPNEDNNPLAGYYCPACGEALEEGHDCSEIDVLAQAAWNSYKSGICPCGNAECGGIEWLSDGNDPFERLADL